MFVKWVILTDKEINLNSVYHQGKHSHWVRHPPTNNFFTFVLLSM